MLIVALVVQATPAYAYWDVGRDPEDSGGGFLDLRRTVRVTRAAAVGSRWLTIKFRGHGSQYQYIWRVKVYLDSRGDRRTDYIMTLAEFDQAPVNSCVVRPRPGRPGEPVSGIFGVRDLEVRCTVELSAVHPTKRIRWRLISIDWSSGRPRFVDHAPDGRAFYG